MTASKRIFSWIIISLVIQCSIYLYLNNFYFSPEGNIKVTKIDSVNKINKIKPNVTFTNTDKDISLSDDFTYTAYMSGGLVKIVDTTTGKERKINFTKGIQCLAYKWVPGTNRMIIAEKLNGSSGKIIKFFSYDADKQAKAEIYNYESKKEDAVTAGQSVDLQISELTGVLYAKVSYSSVLDRIYRIDRNETLTRVSTVTRNIGNIAVASNDDQLVYEDLTYDRMRSNYTPQKTIILNGGVYRSSLLGSDNNDNFYIGVGKSQISKIYYGKLTENTSSWKELYTGGLVNTNDVVISSDNNVYVVDKNQDTITDIKDNKRNTFSGSFIELNNNSVVSKIGNKLTIKSF
ncbi:hypothetical protein [Clostridium pasteurianum]|uniref:Uncharacterized protein n=1 Tax=Clostridium pasteurianum BC1 TaxID=86416 RepID=R4K856_CLOPA|nr:hypothetical protein [Clostridium pasteurianum]AGK96704.1 hypothetical protein Clopa_1796 [Clostridium pasteurianum BC1]